MAKVFEDYFSELQADMVTICLEYVNNVADKIFIYGSYESNVVACDFFYCINNQILKKHKINDGGLRKYDVSINRQRMVNKILLEDIEKIKEKCKEFKREMPTEIRLIYDVKTHHLDANYSYDIMYTNDADKTATFVVNEWFEEVKNASESSA